MRCFVESNEFNHIFLGTTTKSKRPIKKKMITIEKKSTESDSSVCLDVVKTKPASVDLQSQVSYRHRFDDTSKLHLFNTIKDESNKMTNSASVVVVSNDAIATATIDVSSISSTREQSSLID
jgi:hypothetical protein